jgi:hypothetical protein
MGAIFVFLGLMSLPPIFNMVLSNNDPIESAVVLGVASWWSVSIEKGGYFTGSGYKRGWQVNEQG